MATPSVSMPSPPVTATSPAQQVIFENVSKFYGEVLGVNKVSLALDPGVTSLVGPNGSGKTTLMNLITGLIRPTCGSVSVLGLSTSNPEQFCRNIGYCAQFDTFPKGITGRGFVDHFLRLHGYDARTAAEMTQAALERVNIVGAADRKVAGYSKGMRQRIRLAQAISHRPTVLVLDEPLNGLDPMARAESLDLFRQLGREGSHVIISSHILHEVDEISDRVVLLSYGYVVAEGQIQGVREEVSDQPMQIVIRCDRPAALAAWMFSREAITEGKLADVDTLHGNGLIVRTRDTTQFYGLLNRAVVEERFEIESVAPADDDVMSVYQYLIGSEGASR